MDEQISQRPKGGERPDFTLEDFRTGRVFEWLTGLKSGYQQAMQEQELALLAQEVGFKGFPKCLREYRKDLNKTRMSVIRDDGVAEFADQPLDLNVGEWTADESGIWRYGANGSMIYACTHPIMPVQRMASIDTGLVKIKLLFRRGYNTKKPWSEIVVPSSRISKASDIVGLSDCGVSVTSGERAQALVDYLRDAIDRNPDLIPEVKAVSRMGWNEEGFSPYVGGVVFDSADAFRAIYKDLRQAGSMKKWMAEALEARTYSVTARIVLAASFASVLVEPLGCLPFFVHLWGIGSGTGKSVSQMLGAAAWGNPLIGGGYFQTFRGTSVSMELKAGFLHSLPMFLDDLQLAKDKRGKIVFDVYELASGTGKARANKSLGLDYTPKWANCFITSGETPLASENDGAGALNRVIEIECKDGEKVIRDGHRTANVLKANYGHAGKLFVDKLCEGGGLEQAKELYETYYAACIQSDTTEKQAMAAALILTADHLATDWIFHDGRALSAGELGEFLKTRAAVSLADRGYETLCDWVASNASRFRERVDAGEHYGVVEDGVAIINRSVWNRVCGENAISSKALLSSLKVKGLLVLGPKGYTKTRRIDGIPTACVWMKLPFDDGETGGPEEIPL